MARGVRVFLTGASGFVMGAVAQQLRERGDDVTALVRSRARAQRLVALGCDLVEGDLDTISTSALAGQDIVVHGAAIYEVGVGAARAKEMRHTNVDGTAQVLARTKQATVPKTVYVSTIAAFGNTRGAIVTEGFAPIASPTSIYEDTKRRAHELALAAIREGQPIVIVQPGQVYGPGDHSTIGASFAALARGRLRYRALAGVGLCFVHVDDVADGIVRAIDQGRAGESYVLGGEIARLDYAYRTLARVTGRALPRLLVPDALLRVAARFPSALREVVRSADGVTFWASDARAQSELGTTPRVLEVGFRQTFVPGP